MKRVISFFTILFIYFLLISSFPSVASACSCVELPSVEEEFERSQAVFSGKVLDVSEKRQLNSYATKTVLFEVTNTWKGVTQSQIMITTGLGGGDCGIDFKEGYEYLVYASESSMYGNKSLVTIICDRTNELSVLQEDLKLLGEGQPPTEDIDLRSNLDGSQFYIWITVLISFCIILIFVYVRFKSKQKHKS